jgi:hypothetical protein
MSSSAYPVIWAMKHAPVADALERLILIAMADAADNDGCNSYRSKRSLTDIAVDVDDETIRRRQREMEKRGLIRPDTTPPRAAYLAIPSNRRTRRWEVCIPYSWWSEAQREEIQRERADNGLPPITPKSRPDLPDAPRKKARADKGKPNPNRRPKKTREQGGESRGLSERGQEEPSRGLSERGPGASTRGPRGPLQEDQPSFAYLPVEPSSSCVTRTPQGPEVTTTQEEEGSSTKNGKLDVADALVDEAVAKWDAKHRPPTAAERRRLVVRVDEALSAGAPPQGVVYTLTRDLDPGQVKTTAVQVVTSRTRTPGWVESPPAAVVRPPRPNWCEECDERTRQIENPDGRMRRCPTCHPSTATATVPQQASAPAQETPTNGDPR